MQTPMQEAPKASEVQGETSQQLREEIQQRELHLQQQLLENKQQLIAAQQKAMHDRAQDMQALQSLGVLEGPSLSAATYPKASSIDETSSDMKFLADTGLLPNSVQKISIHQEGSTKLEKANAREENSESKDLVVLEKLIGEEGGTPTAEPTLADKSEDSDSKKDLVVLEKLIGEEGATPGKGPTSAEETEDIDVIESDESEAAEALAQNEFAIYQTLDRLSTTESKLAVAEVRTEYTGELSLRYE